MKKLFFILISVCLVFSSCRSVETINYDTEIADIEKVFYKNLNSDIGYCDVSEYYISNYFLDIKDIEEYKIYTSNDSTNFDEFGIFKFTTEKAARKYTNTVKNYLNKSANEFQNGIIYNINEYPKFQNADVKVFGKYLVYTILLPEKSEEIFKEIKLL